MKVAIRFGVTFTTSKYEFDAKIPLEKQKGRTRPNNLSR